MLINEGGLQPTIIGSLKSIGRRLFGGGRRRSPSPPPQPQPQNFWNTVSNAGGTWTGQQLFGQRTNPPPPPSNLTSSSLSDWQLPEEGLLQTGDFATQLAKQRQQQDANLLASGLTRQQILQQRGSENIVRELSLSKMIAEQRRRAIQDWLQTVSGLQQQVRPPDFAGLREMATALQQGTGVQQQLMMKVFENIMRQGG